MLGGLLAVALYAPTAWGQDMDFGGEEPADPEAVPEAWRAFFSRGPRVTSEAGLLVPETLAPECPPEAPGEIPEIPDTKPVRPAVSTTTGETGALPAEPARAAVQPAPVPGGVTRTVVPAGPAVVRRLEPNVLTLDFVDVSAGGDITSTNPWANFSF